MPPLTALGPLNTALGAPLASTWLMSSLSTLEVLMAATYWRTYDQDDRWRKICVIMVLVFDGTSIISAYAFSYLYTVLHWGDTEYLSQQHWPIAVYLIANSATEASVLLFLIAKVYNITQKAWLAALLCIGPLGVLSGAIATAALNMVYMDVAFSRFRAKVAVTVWVVLLVTSNVAIAGTLIFRLNTLRAEQAEFQITTRYNKLQHIVYSAWITGGFMALLSIILMAVYFSDEESNVPVAFVGPMSSLYALVMLTNLNDRAPPTAPLNRHRVAPLGLHGQISLLEGKMLPSTNVVTTGADLFRKGPDW